MNELEIKKVPFMGKELIAVRDKSGDIWVGVRHMCDGIGLTHGQANRQMLKIIDSPVLAMGRAKLPIITDVGYRRAVCLKLDYIPLWLAKISITEEMERETPDVVERLIEYRMKAKDAIEEAFASGRGQAIPKTYAAALRSLASEVERNEALEQKMEAQNRYISQKKPRVTYYDIIFDRPELVDISEIAKDYGWGESMMNRYLQKAGVQHKQYGVWLLNKNHVGMGYTKTKTTAIKDKNGESYALSNTYWTRKGRLFIYDSLKKEGILPLIERNSEIVA